MVLGNPDIPFKGALGIDPEDATAKYYLRQISLQRVPLFVHWQEYEEGLEYISEMLEFLPDFPELYLYRGDIYFAMEDPANAEAAYRRYLELGGTESRAAQRTQKTAA